MKYLTVTPQEIENYENKLGKSLFCQNTCELSLINTHIILG